MCSFCWICSWLDVSVCLSAPPPRLLVLLLFLNWTPPSPYWQVCLFWIYGAFSQLGYWCRRFVMITICAQPAPTQIYSPRPVRVRAGAGLFRDVVWTLLFWFEGYPGGYPATTPTYTPNLYQTGSPGYPPGEHHTPHTWFDNVYVIRWSSGGAVSLFLRGREEKPEYSPLGSKWQYILLF